MNEPPLPESLDKYLQAPPRLPVEADAQSALLQRTIAMLPRRRGWRRWPIVAGIAASIALALITAYRIYLGEQVELAPKQNLVERKPAPLPEKPAEPEEESKPPVAKRPMNALDLEWAAFDAPEDSDRVRLYFQAGDLYLERHKDYESALRCYAQAFHYCATRELEFNPNDNWLVMALKRDHRKEN